MKKKVIHFVQSALVKILFFGASYQLHAQVSNPSSWESFVNSSNNTLVSDTFRLQTFGDSEWDNWEYTTSGTTQIQDVSSVNIDKLGGKMGLQMSLGSRIDFMQYTPTLYTDVKAEIFFGGRYLDKGNNLNIQIYRETGSTTHMISSITKNDSESKYDSLAITNTPLRFDLYTSSSSSNTKGYYCLQYALAYGNIPTNSLFTGTGDWNDTIRWSHLPPLRHRNALINGNATITTNTYCNNAAVSSGNLQIAQNIRLSLNNLDLFETDASIRSEGEIIISDHVTFHKTFEKAGKWYFISFPFDVYPSGIDPRFEQKDDTPNDGGNYFYVQSYNGDKRASTNQSTGNWEVAAINSNNTPLFEKNKGYLIALDEKATEQTITFSSRPDDIPVDFGNTGAITIPLDSDITSGNEENYGWYLCGNPLPAPLLLSGIEKNMALDGNIYVYDGSGYKTYSLNSNYALPPFAAFFIKASSPTELKVSSNSTSTKAMEIIQTNFPLNKSIAEPHPAKQNTAIGNPHTKDFHFFIKDKQLYLRNIPETGYIRLLNMMGQCLLQKEIRQGSQVIRITDRPGMYILQIHSAKYQKHQKVILL